MSQAGMLPGMKTELRPRTREKRWRELYHKHDIAWMEWKMRAQADRREASGFVECN
jgi:hypothetical protein